MFNLNQLRTFVQVVELGSFNKVAEEEYLSANAVMMQINNLENELGGTKLLLRSKRGNVITPAGEELYKEAKKILELCAKAKRHTIDVGNADENTVRIMVNYGNSLFFYSKLLKELHKRYPEIRLEIVDTIQDCKTGNNVWKNFNDWTDIAISHISEKDIAEEASVYDEITYTGIVINSCPYQALMDSNHILAEKDWILFEDLIGEQVYVSEELWYKDVCPLAEYLKKNYSGIELQSISFIGTDTYNECGNGGPIIITGADSEVVHPFIKGVSVKTKDDDFVKRLGFIHQYPPKPCVKKFISAVEEILNEIPDIIES